MSYTSKNLNSITLLLAILIFLCLYLIASQISFSYSNHYIPFSAPVYSGIIPIEKQSREIETIATTNKLADNLLGFSNLKNESTKSILQQEIEQAELLSSFNQETQREVLKKKKNSPWRIEIPKLGLNAPIEQGVSSNTLLKAVGHFEATSKWNGNVCLAAHNRGYQCSFFQKIKQLKRGDTIIYHTLQGKKIYQVQTNCIILETDWSYLEETKDNRITLITCEENRREYRRCIQAVQIAENTGNIAK